MTKKKIKKLSTLKLKENLYSDYIGDLIVSNDTIITKNFSGKTFYRIDFSNCVFKDISFLKSEFDEITFSNCIFEYVDLRRSIIENSTFRNCQFVGNIGFGSAEFDTNLFINCKFNDVHFNFTEMTDCKFELPTFNKVVFSETILLNVTMTQPNFHEVNFYHTRIWKEITSPEIVVNDLHHFLKEINTTN